MDDLRGRLLSARRKSGGWLFKFYDFKELSLVCWARLTWFYAGNCGKGIGWCCYPAASVT